MDKEQKKIYLNEIIKNYKENPDSLNSYEKLIIKHIIDKQNVIISMSERMRKLEEEVRERQEQLQLLDKEMIFERGQLAGIFNSLVALKSEK